MHRRTLLVFDPLIFMPAYPLIKASISKGPDPVEFLRLRIVK
jgi:hypothetical protein